MLEQHGFSPFPANLPHHQGDYGLLDADYNHDLHVLDACANHGDDDSAANFSCKAR